MGNSLVRLYVFPEMVDNVFPEEHGVEGQSLFSRKGSGSGGSPCLLRGARPRLRRRRCTRSSGEPRAMPRPASTNSCTVSGLSLSMTYFWRKACFSAVGFQNVPEHESLGRGDVVFVCEISQIDVGQPGMAVGKGKHHDQVFPEKGDGMFILHMMNAGIEGEIRMFRSGFHLGVDDFQRAPRDGLSGIPPEMKE